MDIQLLMNVASMLFGGAGVFAFLMSWKKERSLARISELNEVSEIQKIYKTLIADTANELAKMKTKTDSMEMEIQMLHKMVQGYQKRCLSCNNNSTNDNNNFLTN